MDWSAGMSSAWPVGCEHGRLVRILSDGRDLHTPVGHISVGWLVVEDLFTVLALVLLPALFGTTASSLPVALGFTALKVVSLGVFTVVVGSRAIPRLLDYAAATGSRELFTLTVLVLALGIAVGSALVFGVSMALGAFLAGLVVGRSEYSLRAASEALPMRDAFAVLFFVSVGMLLDPGALVAAPALFAATLAVVLVGKPLVALALVRLMRYPFRVALSVAIALAQIGEFSFILSSMGRDLGILTSEATNTIVAASIVSIVLNPLLYRLVAPIEQWAAARPAVWAIVNPAIAAEAFDGSGAARSADPRHRAIVVGYGPTGRTMTRLLRENGVEPTIVELNVETVRQLRQDGITAVYGDATQPATLEGAGAPAPRPDLTSAGMGSSAGSSASHEPQSRVRVQQAAYLQICRRCEGRYGCRLPAGRSGPE